MSSVSRLIIFYRRQCILMSASFPGRLLLAFLALITSPHSRRCALYPCPSSWSPLSRILDTLFYLSMHSRIRPSSKLQIPLAHLGNFLLLFAVVNALSYYRHLSF